MLGVGTTGQTKKENKATIMGRREYLSTRISHFTDSSRLTIVKVNLVFS